jgi:general secretion pathway protein L
MAAPDLTAETQGAPLENAIFYATREDWALVQDEIDKVVDEFGSLKIQLLPDGPLPWLARDFAATDAINLLQGEFARTTDYGARWHRWRTAAALAGALLIVHVAAQAYQWRQAKRDSAALDSEIAQVFATAMPSDQMQDPRRQMQLRLDRIRHSGPGPQYFLRTLQTLSGALATAPKTSVDSMSYREQALDLKVTAPSLAALSQLSQSVGREGLTAEIQSSTPVGDGVEAHLQVRAKDSKARR